MNWNKGHICSADWNHGDRKSVNDLPDIPIPADQRQKIQKKCEAAKNVLEKYKTAPQKLRIRYKNAKHKLEIASQMSKDSQDLVKRTPVIRERTLVPHLEKRLHLKNNIKKSWTNYLVKMHV